MIVVSGLPRSGTSMMMKMLQFGGLNIFMDETRKADVDNPYGYFEHVKMYDLLLDVEQDWLSQVGESAIKIPSEILTSLPEDYEYQVIYMVKDLREILQSQRKMETRLGNVVDKSDVELLSGFRKHLNFMAKWMSEQANFDFMYLLYNSVFRDPDYAISRVKTFLDLDLNIEAMKGAIDPNLYRNKNHPD